MNIIYEADHFNKVLDFFAFEESNNNEFHIFRFETAKKKDCDVIAPLHRQHFFDISLFIEVSNSYQVLLDGSPQIIDNYMLQIVPPFQLISFTVPQNLLQKFRGYTLQFSFDFLCIGINKPNFLSEFDFFKITNQETHFKLTPPIAEHFIFIFEKMLYEYQHGQARSKQILQGYLWVLLNESKKIFDNNRDDNKIEKKPKQPQKIFESFQAHISQNIRDVFSVEEYADMLNITPNHLTQTIKETTGKSPKDFINERRLIEAKSLLQGTDLTISETAYLLNFSEPTHFTKFFKKETGLTPLEFLNKTNQ